MITAQAEYLPYCHPDKFFCLKSGKVGGGTLLVALQFFPRVLSALLLPLVECLSLREIFLFGLLAKKTLYLG